MTTIVRAQILHTPRDPFAAGGAALEAFSDGGLAYDDDGRILATGAFGDVRRAHPAAPVLDASDAVLLPGLVDLHVHDPQIAVIGAMGMTLLEWLATRTLPEEARLADTAYATAVASAFVRGLARNGTTAALVFGSHFPGAQEALFDAAERSGLLAHDVHVSDDELGRLARADATIAHCPSSNAFLASGIFAMARHCRHGVRFGLGTDVGAGTGLSLFKEALMAYHVQMVRAGGELIGPAHLLHLATKAGAEALGLGDEIGDLSPGRSADFVLVRPPADSTLATALRNSPSAEATLGALFTLAREECVAEARVAGEPVLGRGAEPEAGRRSVADHLVRILSP